jgi:hypothetical protein
MRATHGLGGGQVEVASCDWIVDSCLPSQREPCWDVAPRNQTGGLPWHAHWCHTYLDAAASPAWGRAFLVPGITDRANVFGLFCVYGRHPAPRARPPTALPTAPAPTV